MAIEKASARKMNAIKGRDVIKEYSFFIGFENLLRVRKRNPVILNVAENNSYLE